jgi:hypothetical protein
VPHGAVNLTPLLRVIGTPKMPFLFLLQGLLATISVVPSVLVIASVSCVDLTVFLLPRGPLAPSFQKSGLGFGGLYAHINDCEQIDHRLGLLHSYLLHSLDVTDPVVKGIDDLNVLDVRDSVLGITEKFYVVSETLIMLLPDGLQCLYCRLMLIRALQVPNEHGT